MVCTGNMYNVLVVHGNGWMDLREPLVLFVDVFSVTAISENTPQLKVSFNG